MGGEGGVGGTGSGGSGGEATGGTGGEDCPAGVLCDGEYNYAFVTSTRHSGDLGGLEGADRICNDLAKAAKLPGTYVAWLSDSSVDAQERIGSANGWIGTDRRPFARTAADLLARKIVYPLDRDERGERVDSPWAWMGDTSGDNCTDWSTSSSDHQAVLYRIGSGHLTPSIRRPCGFSYPLICLGTDFDAPLPEVRVEGRLAFLSKATFQADRGLEGADEICQQEALAEGLEGEFVAMLATRAEPAIARVSAEGETWVRPDGVALWAAAADAWEGGGLLAPIHLDAAGEVVDRIHFMLGADGFNAKAVDGSCEDWTTADGAKPAVVVSAKEIMPTGDLAVATWDCAYASASVVCFQK
jgi:hypothetical protein